MPNFSYLNAAVEVNKHAGSPGKFRVLLLPAPYLTLHAHANESWYKMILRWVDVQKFTKFLMIMQSANLSAALNDPNLVATIFVPTNAGKA